MTASTSGKIGVDYATEDGSTPVFNLGECDVGVDGTEWMYVEAGSAVTQYQCVTVDEDHKAYPITEARLQDGWRVGFAQIAHTKGKHGWVAMRGSNIKCLLLKSCAADVALYATATKGVLDDSGTTTSDLGGVVAVAAASASAPATGQAIEVIATWPRNASL